MRSAEWTNWLPTVTYESSARTYIPHSALRILFVSQRVYRIETRRPAGRPDAEEQPDRGAEDERQQNRERRYEGIPVRQLGQDHGAERPDHHADQAPDEAQHEGLHEELKQDVEARGAERLAHADLAGALGHGHEHDVHDADAADEDADRRAAGEQVLERIRGLLEGGGE